MIENFEGNIKNMLMGKPLLLKLRIEKLHFIYQINNHNLNVGKPIYFLELRFFYILKNTGNFKTLLI